MKRTSAKTPRWVLLSCVGLPVLMTPVLASAERGGGTAEETLERGRALISETRYAQAVEELEVVAANESAPVRTRLEALEVLGVLHASRERESAAREAFEWLLTLDPGHRLSDPSVTGAEEEFFDAVRTSFRPEVTATMEVSAPERVTGDGPLRLAATLGGDVTSVVSVAVYHRAEDDMAFSRAAMSCDGTACSVDLPNPSDGAGLVFYVEAQAPSGHPLAAAGSLEEPLRVAGGDAETPAGGEGSPDSSPFAGSSGSGEGWYRTWWFWTIVGVVVAGVAAGTTAAVVLTLPPEEVPDGDLGSLHLPLGGRW